MHAVAIAAALLLAAPAAIPSPPTRWVEDHAGLMSETARGALDGRLEAYQHATGHQVVVWIGDTLGGADLADWAVRTFAAWKVGQKGIDDGVAMFVFATDRTIDLEVGYGLEDRVPDAIASRIIAETMAPRLRAGDADGAIAAGAEAILTAIEGQPWPGGPTPPRQVAGVSRGQTIGTIIAGLVLVLLAIRYPRLALLLLWFGGRGGRRGGGGFGGGGGGFSGGGGSSGGGGARGGW